MPTLAPTSSSCTISLQTSSGQPSASDIKGTRGSTAVLTGLAGRAAPGLAGEDGALLDSEVPREAGIIVSPLNGSEEAGGGVGADVRLLRIEMAGDGCIGSTGSGAAADSSGADSGATGAGGGVGAGGTLGRIEMAGRGGNGAAWLGAGAGGVAAAGGGGVGETGRIEIAGRGGIGAAGLAAKMGGSAEGLATNSGGSTDIGW